MTGIIANTGAIVLVASLGKGAIFSAIPIFLYQETTPGIIQTGEIKKGH